MPGTRLAFGVLAIVYCFSSGAAAAAYPERPLRYVLGSAPGGGPDLGLIVVGSTPEQFAAHSRKETARWADVVKRAGAKVDS